MIDLGAPPDPLSPLRHRTDNRGRIQWPNDRRPALLELELELPPPKRNPPRPLTSALFVRNPGKPPSSTLPEQLCMWNGEFCGTALGLGKLGRDFNDRSGGQESG